VALKTASSIPQQLPEANYSNASLVLTWETDTILLREDQDTVCLCLFFQSCLYVDQLPHTGRSSPGVTAVGFATLAYFVDLLEYFGNRRKKILKNKRKHEQVGMASLASQEEVVATDASLANVICVDPET
jgi:hypothetical protein